MAKHLTPEEFFEKARLSHGLKYDYTKTKFEGTTKLVNITCNLHGEFFVLGSTHLRGEGCPKCDSDKVTKNFIGQSIIVHGDKYDYSKAVVTKYKIPVTIICREHGPFEMIPRVHAIEGKSCPKCVPDRKKVGTYTPEELHKIFVKSRMGVFFRIKEDFVKSFVTADSTLPIYCISCDNRMFTTLLKIKSRALHRCFICNPVKKKPKSQSKIKAEVHEEILNTNEDKQDAPKDMKANSNVFSMVNSIFSVK
jgi:RNA polymerase subunit RPABC4/transcription elongation factor Spt4